MENIKDQNVRDAIKEKFLLFKENPNYPYHPSLRIKQMEGFPGIYEGHISKSLVFTFHKEVNKNGDQIIVFRKIGTHDIYKIP
jgi:hypothetical protein